MLKGIRRGIFIGLAFFVMLLTCCFQERSDEMFEFDVEMTCASCENAVRKALTGVPGIKSLSVDLERGQVLVESTLSSDRLKSLIEDTGRRAVIKGMGGTQKTDHLGAAVCILEAGDEAVRGVVRFIQSDDEKLVLDGTVDGLAPGKHAIYVHECGDISDGCNSCGDVFGSDQAGKTAVGEIGDIEAGDNGRAEFRLINSRIKVWEMIGRSLMVHSAASNLLKTHQSENTRVSCGIIARSAGLFENSKKICACDGVTQWDERYVPIAGAGRQARNSNL